MTAKERSERRRRPEDLGITDWLRESIIEGDLPPGARLSETTLGNDLGVSRTPVREALRVLATEELVDWERNRSAVVRTVSNETVVEALDLLGALEMLAAARVVEHADEEQMARLEVAYARYRRQALDPSVPKYFGVNMHLHLALAEAAGNAMLARFHRIVVTHLIRARHMIDITGYLDSSIRDHGRLMDAIFARDIAVAQLAIAEHVEEMKRNLSLTEAEPVSGKAIVRDGTPRKTD